MKWLLRSFIMFAVASCITVAVLAKPLQKYLPMLSMFQDGADMDFTLPGLGPDSAKASHSERATTSLVAQMNATNQTQLREAIAQIQTEFGISVSPQEFSSHHAANDYLKRLRLAKGAEGMGVDVDPMAFGDYEAMRYHLERSLKGRVPDVTVALADAAGSSSDFVGPPAPERRDYIFIYGHRYYNQGNGIYVRDDGTVLQTARRNRTQPQRTASSPAAADDKQTPSLNADWLAEIDTMLDMMSSTQNNRK